MPANSVASTLVLGVSSPLTRHARLTAPQFSVKCLIVSSTFFFLGNAEQRAYAAEKHVDGDLDIMNGVMLLASKLHDPSIFLTKQRTYKIT